MAEFLSKDALELNNIINAFDEPCMTVMEEDAWDIGPEFEFAIETIALDHSNVNGIGAPPVPGPTAPTITTSSAEGFHRFDLPRIPTTLHAFEHMNGRYFGPHNFVLSFQNEYFEKRSKTNLASWSYSAIADKLFVNMGCPVPFTFNISSSLPRDTILRASPRYIQPEHRKVNVIRCPNHQQQDNNGSDAPREHILRLKCKGVTYHTDSICGRQSLTIPWEMLEKVRANGNSRMGPFLLMCFSSCPGGLHRRPFEIVFTLESEGRILGSTSIEVRICACPGRDKKAAEERHFRKVNGSQNPNSVSLSPQKHRQAPPDTADIQRIVHHETVSKFELGSSHPRDTKLYEIKVRGRGNFRLIKQIVDGLHVLECSTDFASAISDSNKPKDGKSARDKNIKRVTPDIDLGGDTEPESDEEIENNCPPKKKPASDAYSVRSGEPDFSFLSRTRLAGAVQAWLQALGLSQYQDAFIASGYDDIEILSDLDDTDLDHIGVKLPGHRKKILLARTSLEKALASLQGKPVLQSRPSLTVTRNCFVSERATKS